MIGELGIELRLIVVVPDSDRPGANPTCHGDESHIDVFFYTIKPIEPYALKNIL